MTEPAQPSLPEAKGTRYKILLARVLSELDDQERDNGYPVWVEQDTVTAASQSAAIRAHAQKAGAGTYVAVPARSWEPVEVAVETTTRLKLT